ncbi:Protein mono-ADP-ribosyltransferase TIPARP [Varanus komodoensis]|nr:Protein mono-ADP-ribosyltransferase TIPARP [Varanus komodoensis]
MRKAGLEEPQVGIKIAGRNINNLRYADDTTLMAESEEELKSLLMRVKEESAKVGLKLNIKKTKVMASGPLTSWQIDGEEMEVVTNFIFLGSMITADSDCSQEIKRRLLLGRKAITNLDSILRSRDITLPTKVHIVKAMVFPVAMYGCESWTIRKAEHQRIEAFELWCWRRLLQVPWTARRSNQSVLEDINPDCSLEGQILKMNFKYFGHLMRRKDSLEKTLMLGTIDSKRRGQQRMRWIDGVTEAVGVQKLCLLSYLVNLNVCNCCEGSQISSTVKTKLKGMSKKKQTLDFLDYSFMAEKAKCSDTELGHNTVEDCLLGITVLRPTDADNLPLYHGQIARPCVAKMAPSTSKSEKSGSCYFLNLDTMMLSDNPFYDQVRRLSNSSDHTCNCYFPAEWKVYWYDLGYWKEYKEEIDARSSKKTPETHEWKMMVNLHEQSKLMPIAQDLVAAFKQKRQRHTFSLHNRHYKVNIKRLTQRNVKTGFTRRIKYRPVLRYSTSIVRYLWSVALSCEAKAVRGENPLDLYCGPYPAVWIPPPQGDVGFTMEEMAWSEIASLKVRELFHSTLSEKQALILAIYRIRNDHLWHAYMRQKERMSQERSEEDQMSLEKHLFHGTEAARIKRICTENFHVRFSGLHGTVYGKGIYFAKDASYSHSYASMTEGEMCHMFLTKVLTGYWTNGHSGLKRPPVSYDSCTDFTTDPDIFVIFKSCQCYPYFLIRYKKVDMTVAIDA